MSYPTNLKPLPPDGWIKCRICERTQPQNEFLTHNKDRCNGCRREQRGYYHVPVAAQRNTSRLQVPQHLARWSSHGKYPPPFKAGTPAYSRWYKDVLVAFSKDGGGDWPGFYARAKAMAAVKPPSDAYVKRRHRALFGGSNSRDYQEWYRKTLQACKAAGSQDWPAWFAKAKEVEMRRQGLLPPAEVLDLPKIPNKPSTTIEDGPLMFDFTLPEDADA